MLQTAAPQTGSQWSDNRAPRGGKAQHPQSFLWRCALVWFFWSIIGHTCLVTAARPSLEALADTSEMQQTKAVKTGIWQILTGQQAAVCCLIAFPQPRQKLRTSAPDSLEKSARLSIWAHSHIFAVTLQLCLKTKTLKPYFLKQHITIPN